MTQSEERRVLAEYVAGLQGLCAEVSAATLALSKNDLSDFQARLQAQQSICQRLEAVVLPPATQATSETGTGSDSDQTAISELRVQLHQTQAELARRNSIFAGLVKRSALTVSWLSLLCQSYTERYGKDRCVPAHSSLSCEV